MCPAVERRKQSHRHNGIQLLLVAPGCIYRLTLIQSIHFVRVLEISNQLSIPHGTHEPNITEKLSRLISKQAAGKRGVL